jgi:hypothetical protein
MDPRANMGSAEQCERMRSRAPIISIYSAITVWRYFATHTCPGCLPP